MGCMVDKAPDCFHPNENPEEILTIISKPPNEYYNELLHPFIIQDHPTLNLTIPPASLRNQFSSKDLTQKDFPIFSHTTSDLIHFAYKIFQISGLDTPKLISFLSLINQNYLNNLPFHNFWHGFSVFQMIYVIGSRNSQLNDFLIDKEYMILLLAAIGHDVNHPGFNNSFLIATKHDLALKYNNNSVLENHHIYVMLEILKASEIFGFEDMKNISLIIIEAILSTDMACHKKVCDDYLLVLGRFDKGDRGCRQKFANYLLHCADLGNQALDFQIASLWSLKILREFNLQVICEEKYGIQVSEFLRTGNDINKIKASQIGFIDNIILPLWVKLAEKVENIEDFPEELKRNKKKWEELKGFE
ncbi:hypothetical protein SteCoe_26091 [Stentor coeruleus]|uniref:PDEase domain-containing protein n=1 Tax=Stentor coeruleus TaxID=5963 RepID=A0A1R2BDQ8_9CILI|nr:hypothetical protein SteCoe_26091 [Stentor coeruleus]